MREYPSDLIEDHIRLSSLVEELLMRYRNRILIHVIDPQSALGFYKSLRYWVREYPSFIIEGEQKITGWDQAMLEQAIQSRLSIP
jgi:hypothetical protein